MSELSSSVLSSVSKLDPTSIASTIVDIASKIYDQYQQMQENKSVCQDLNKEVGIIKQIVLDLSRTKQIDYCQATLVELQECLKQCLKLIQSITVKKSVWGKIKDFLSAGSNKDIITKLITQLHSIADILNLALTAQTSNNVKDIMGYVKKLESEKITDIQKSNKEMNKDIDGFISKVNQVINIDNKGGVQLGDGNTQNNIFDKRNNNAAIARGGDVNVIVQAAQVQGQPVSGRNSPQFDVRALRRPEDVLERLKEMFRNEEYEGEKSKNYDVYNHVLKDYRASLSYKKSQMKHVLYLDDKELTSEEAERAIMKMIRSLGRVSSFAAPAAYQDNPSTVLVGVSKLQVSSATTTTSSVQNQPKSLVFSDIKDSRSSSITSNSSSGFRNDSHSTVIPSMDFKGILSLATQGDARAQYKLGRFYLSEGGSLKNEAKALEWFKKSAGQKDGCAQHLLGYMHEEGLGGLKRDASKALKLYQDALENLLQSKEDPEAQNNLGLMYEKSRGVTGWSVTKKACEWYESAAKQGHAGAQNNLGRMYANGTGVVKNVKRAFELYGLAAKQGCAQAQVNLGLMYANGQEVAKDEKIACELYDIAASQENADAQFHLGLMYANGRSVAKDEKKAFKLFEAAAKQGHVLAQCNLGEMYENGRGVAKDIEKACEWHKLAANDGDCVFSQAALGRLQSKASDKSEKKRNKPGS